MEGMWGCGLLSLQLVLGAGRPQGAQVDVARVMERVQGYVLHGVQLVCKIC